MNTPAIDIDRLSPEQRLHLLEELWESLRKDPHTLPLTQAHREELDHRLDELDNGDMATIPWEEVKRHIQVRKR